MKKEIERQRRTQGSLGLLMVDLDHFKRVNDTCGHLVGDVVLQEVARRLASAIRTYDSIGRYGGEEFLILVPGCDAFNLVVTADRLRRAVADRPIDTCAGPITITLSVGMAAAEPADLPSLNSETFLRTADAALYSAKAKGRNRVESAPAELARATPALEKPAESFPQRR
jgi:diguanylate cyclase (GGDEF)-like protein